MSPWAIDARAELCAKLSPRWSRRDTRSLFHRSCLCGAFSVIPMLNRVCYWQHSVSPSQRGFTLTWGLTRTDHRPTSGDSFHSETRYCEPWRPLARVSESGTAYYSNFLVYWPQVQNMFVLLRPWYNVASRAHSDGKRSNAVVAFAPGHPLVLIDSCVRKLRATRAIAAQNLARNGDVVEGDLSPRFELLALLVTFTVDHQHVPRIGTGDPLRDRLPPVGLVVDVAAGARQDLLDDRLRILRTRVVRGHDHPIRHPAGDLAHQRPLTAIAVAAAAEYDVEPPVGQAASGPEHVLQRIRRMRVVDQHREPLTLVDGLKASRDLACGRDRLERRFDRYLERAGGRECSEHVVDVELSPQWRV